MKRILERAKIDVGVAPQAINNTNVTGRYYSMKGFRRALAILAGGAMAATKASTIEFLQAQDAAGTGAKGIPTTAGQTATATITANTAVTEATLTLASVLNTQAVTINGLTFTGHTDTTTKSVRQFAINGDDTADAAALASCINDATYGAPGVTAVAALGVVTLKSTDPGKHTITIADAAATITPATTQAQAYVEIDAGDLAAGFTHVAVKVTSTANTVAGAMLLREGGASPVQKVGGSAAI